MTYTSVSLCHPSLSYRLTGAIAQAAYDKASGPRHVGYSLLSNRLGAPIASIRLYSVNRPGDLDIYSGNRSLFGEFNIIPGFAARCTFGQALGAAEAAAIVKEY